MTFSRRLTASKQEGKTDHQKPSTSKQETFQEETSSSASSESDDASIESSFSYELTLRQKTRHEEKKTATKLHVLAEVCDRTGFSDRAASFIAYVLEDVGSIRDDDVSAVIDRIKIRRAGKKSSL